MTQTIFYDLTHVCGFFVLCLFFSSHCVEDSTSTIVSNFVRVQVTLLAFSLCWRQKNKSSTLMQIYTEYDYNPNQKKKRHFSKLIMHFFSQPQNAR